MSEEVINQSTESAQPAAQSTPEVTAGNTAEVTTSAEAAQTQEYQPNYKFKVSDEEKEFDEFIRPVIKDAETEKKIRKLYEDAYGIEPLKAGREKHDQIYQELESQHREMSEAVNNVLFARDNGDIEQVLELVGIEQNAVAKWMLDKIKRLNLPPEEKQVYDGYDAARREKSSLERRLQAMEQSLVQRDVQARTTELSTVLRSPEVADVAKAYEARTGKPGAFKDLVVKIGRMEWASNKVDLTPEQAVQQAIELVGTGGQPGQAAQPIAEKIPVIPRIGSKAVSAQTKLPSSIEDLKKMAKSFNN